LPFGLFVGGISLSLETQENALGDLLFVVLPILMPSLFWALIFHFSIH
jgi:hypothetical protein